MKSLKKYSKPVILKNGIIYDPFKSKKHKSNILVIDGIIKEISDSIENIDAMEIDCTNNIITSGFIDIHAHFREPGQENKETLKTGCLSALSGGFTDVCIMPNTSPPLDNPELVKFILDKSKDLPIRIYPIGAITKGQKGNELAEIYEMYKSGVVAISDDGLPVENGKMLRYAIEYCKMLDIPVINHAEDVCLRSNGLMNEGYTSTTLGLEGNPDISESTMIFRDLSIAEYTNGKIHIPHVSTAKSVEIIEEFKKKNVNVTAEVTPHHLFATDKILLEYNTNAKVAPPIRSQKDQDALIKGLKNGVIDCIATDHAPHAIEDKECDFEQAHCGMIGLESAFSLSSEILLQNGFSIYDIIDRFTINPSKIMKIRKKGIQLEADADLCIINPKKEWLFSKDKIYSKSSNTPYLNKKMIGKIEMVLTKKHYFK